MKVLCGMLILAALLTACQSIRYYAQAVGGHVKILSQQRSIEKVSIDGAVSLKTREQLDRISAYRQFAIRELKLPDNKSYTRYVDLNRDYVVWNVVATPRYSVAPVTSCYPVVGCLSYRGYYAKEDALDYAHQLKREGLDVFVGGVSAYSTLGWLEDPVLSTMLTESDAEMAGLMFHELAHQQLYIKGDTKFNESFASTVETLGLKLWANEGAKTDETDRYFSEKANRAEVIKLVLAARERMEAAYGDQSDETKLAEIKQAQFSLLKQEYQVLKLRGLGTKGFDLFFETNLNHASFALFGEYHGWISAFERLFELSGRDWSAFYKAAKKIGEAPPKERQAQLEALQGEVLD